MAKCGQKCEIYARCTGYLRPISMWNKGKREEFKDRKPYDYRVREHKESV
jgi:anaerobic ribonucleoside-triphosphate reductase